MGYRREPIGYDLLNRLLEKQAVDTVYKASKQIHEEKIEYNIGHLWPTSRETHRYELLSIQNPKKRRFYY